MTWFWFILFGIIALTKRGPVYKQIATWDTGSLYRTTWFGLTFWGFMGLFMSGDNVGVKALLHMAAGISGVLGFFTLSEYMKRSAKVRSEQELERIRKLRRRLRNADLPLPDDPVVEPVERGVNFREDPADYGLLEADDAQQTPPEDPSSRLLTIMQRMAQQNEAERSRPADQREDHKPGTAPEAEEAPREARSRTFSVDLDLGGLLSDKPAYVEQEHVGIDLTAPMDPSPTVQDEKPPAEDEPAAPPAGLPEAETSEPPEPAPAAVDEADETVEPEPVAAAAPVPKHAPVRPEGYTPGPTTFGGAAGPLTTGPISLGKPGKVQVSTPRKLKPGFTYKPKLIDPVISAKRITPTKND